MEIIFVRLRYYVKNENSTNLEEQIPQLISKIDDGVFLDGHDDNSTLSRITGLTIQEIEEAKEIAFKHFLRKNR